MAIVLIGALLVWHYFPILKGDSDAREGQPSFNDIDGFVAQERGPQEPVSKGLNPGPGPDLYRSLPTGTEFCKAASEKGSGLLKIDNGTSEDAALRIFDSNTGKTIRCLFVKSHDTTRVKSIPPGQYALRYTSGMDWQGEEQAFRVNPSYNEFERELDYSETHRGNETEYHEIRVTLHPVLNGNVKIHSISRDQFLGR